MICEECKRCDNYEICENGCFGSNEPCEHLRISNTKTNNEPSPNYWGEY